MLGHKHQQKSIELMRIGALNSPHRRLRKNPQWYNGILMDSTWEVELAKRMDSLGIKWERPKPIKWIDRENLPHNYFADFYLPEHDMYLDPKNPYAYSTQLEKIECLKEQLPNLFILRSLKEIKEFNLESMCFVDSTGIEPVTNI